MIEITQSPIDSAQVLAAVQSTAAGAAVLFLGTTREFTHGKQTVRLAYEAYEPMALAELKKLAEKASSQWQLTAVAIVHRVGEVGLGEASVAIAVSSPHRDAAFAAGKWIIDTLKQDVPIWKQEHWSDGTTEWQHPGASDGSRS
ncbi:molybdopterin biosynthesis MoaE protein [Pirellula staleyi DSM 6068]|uniref:Molybdopterin synthase catalytic subunit n=1 Tax=Pirellula staleyi (strain ATCC 27377 / DSM 6068 / ICPB 4128) TaxID=530564 RepID=D2R3R0_PIRSD|nr:molybdenum cofactor biosynthesis protein MoaE [Pirellula staleyi]ADB17014.1 molybdopterin biosynthesis MoaE protein [Pirellula staleyi DSM 6068]